MQLIYSNAVALMAFMPTGNSGDISVERHRAADHIQLAQSTVARKDTDAAFARGCCYPKKKPCCRAKQVFKIRPDGVIVDERGRRALPKEGSYILIDPKGKVIHVQPPAVKKK